MMLLENEKQTLVRLISNRHRCRRCLKASSTAPLIDTVDAAVTSSGVWSRIGIDPEPTASDLERIAQQLDLSCPSCDRSWDLSAELSVVDFPSKIVLPTLNDRPGDFDKMFALWERIAMQMSPHVTIDFSKCGFLRQNAVAFLGGLARMIEWRGGTVKFDWSTLHSAQRRNLEQNGFIAAFGGGIEPWAGNSIAYREQDTLDPDGTMAYLRLEWLGRGWINVSSKLAEMICGKLWELYANSFEHSLTPIGVFTCGQHYPRLHTLSLSVVDFGVGIPANVRRYQKSSIEDRDALKWAFQRGTTTNPQGTGRGLGLDFLRQFISVNGGKMNVYSGGSRSLITEDGTEFTNRQYIFGGTITDIQLKCDETRYVLASEEEDNEPLF